MPTAKIVFISDCYSIVETADLKITNSSIHQSIDIDILIFQIYIFRHINKTSAALGSATWSSVT